MTTEGSMLTAEEDVARVAEPNDRRPDFCAEALSPGVRIGLLLALMSAVGMLFFAVFAMAVWPSLLAADSFSGVMVIGLTLGLAFLMQLVFGALLANNPRLNRGERGLWFAMFALAGPVALPAYWVIEVWPTPYEPSPLQRM